MSQCYGDNLNQAVRPLASGDGAVACYSRLSYWQRLVGLARAAAVAAAVVSLSACGGLLDGSLVDDLFSDAGFARGDNGATDKGLAALMKGDYVQAERHFGDALRADPRNIYAMIGSGLLYQYSGQPTRARAMYEAVLAMRPDASFRLAILSSPVPQKLSDIASVNLALLDSGVVRQGYTGGATGEGGSAMMPGEMNSAEMPMSNQWGAAGQQPMMPQGGGDPAMMGMPAPAMPNMGAQSLSPYQGTDEQQFSVLNPQAMAGESNVVSRFMALQQLLDEGLITPDEYRTRRNANAGALLPYSTTPPAAGLERPIPPGPQIAARLKAIGRAMELRAMTVSEHSAERQMILDALLPAAPVNLAAPPPPPQGLLAAADTVRRLEHLRASGLISSDEYSRERAAIESSVQSGGVSSMNVPTGGQHSQPMMLDGAGASGVGVHLASYRSRGAANRGWLELRQKMPGLLNGLTPAIQQVTLPGKGAFYRLMAGPLPSRAAANQLCSNLKARRQYCDVGQFSPS